MAFASLPLSYCTNVHPGQTVAEVEDRLDRFTVPIKANYGSELAAGLWLAAPVVRELEETPDGIRRFADGLIRRGLSCHTLNAFPYGDFHSLRVKENVYLPDWADARRIDYTVACARVLARLLPPGVEGSISTMPLGFKPFEQPADFADRCADRLIELSRQLNQLYLDSGKVVRIAIEPEPFCVLETTDETLRFFQRLRERAAGAGALDIVNRHLGVCYDICHQAVEFEDIAASIRALQSADVRINKLHITSAIQLESPGLHEEARIALARYVEPRYLHQTFAQTSTGGIVKQVDLDQSLALNPPADFRDAARWRVHFHVPVDAQSLGPLGTTQGEIKKALAGVSALDYAPHLEVETYTWEVLPGGGGTPNIIDGFARELRAAKKLIDG